MCLLIQCTKDTISCLYSCQKYIPAKNTECECDHEATSNKSKLRDIIQTNGSGPFKTQDQERQRKTEECPGWTKGTYQLNAVYDSALGLRIANGH